MNEELDDDFGEQSVLARFASPNLARSASSKQIRAHPARRAFYLIGRIFL